MQFITKFLDIFIDSCGDGIGILVCLFIYLSIFAKRREKWSFRKEIGILILVSLGIAIGFSFVAALLDNIISKY